MSKTVVKKAMILAAGLGTRFKPWTDQHPKALAPVNGKSLLQRNVEYLQSYGIDDVVINVHHYAGQIIEALTSNRGWGSRFTISDETDMVLETGGGLLKASLLMDDGPFVLMNVDILTDMDLGAMIAYHFHHHPLATLAVTNRTTSRYFLFDQRDELCGWRNVTTGEERLSREGGSIQKAFSGIHIIDPAIFPLITRTGKFSTIDMYLDLASRHVIRGFDHSQSRLIDVGRPESAEKAAALFP
ncbi:sugar phosphate nucleotidyltransferase [Puia sp. P3]|uniref:sugar phosphate nucleotidyltransferase n=1 Tax=Puia sp. P3 TaxID=3423952 RepID=UPI003D671FB9